MFRKILKILQRDFIISRRDSMIVLITVMPVILAAGLLLFVPGLNDTSVQFAMLRSEKEDLIKFMQDYSKVELFDRVEDIEKRVERRDDVVGLAPSGDSREIILQGNESPPIQQWARALLSLYQQGDRKENSTAELLSFGLTVPPVKTKLVNMLILTIVMMSGMAVAVSIVGEKADNTVNAINVTPLSQTGFIIGKTMLGALIALFDIILVIVITGYYSINWLMILVIGLSSMLLSFIVGFLQGINSRDIMEAAAGVKMLILPIAGSIAGYELISEKWQWVLYWSPFYWAYRANGEILAGTAEWGRVLLSFAVIVLISLIIYAIFIPKIRKGLS